MQAIVVQIQAFIGGMQALMIIGCAQVENPKTRRIPKEQAEDTEALPSATRHY
jgi:hypothetical protein